MVPYQTPVAKINGWRFPAPPAGLLVGLSEKASKNPNNEQ
jgi:hypothetical protein